jgi:alcohol dehydrogenase
MKALFFDGLMLHLIENYCVPEPAENEALVRILLAGVCATDIEISRGYKDFKGVPGHEFVGIVEQVNGGYPGLVGKRVVGEINFGCGTCEYCLKGAERHCLSRTALGISEHDGVFAEFVAIPLRNLWEVPQSVDDETAVFTEPLAAVFEVFQEVHVAPLDKCAILGDGKMGILLALVLSKTWSHTVLVGKHDHKLAIAARQGVSTKKLDEINLKPSYEIVIDATGSPEGVGIALGLVKPQGVIVLKTTVAEKSTVDLSRVVVNEIKVVGSRCGPFPPALGALARQRIDVKPLISAIYPFDQALAGLQKASEKEAIKVLLDFRETR